MTLKVLGVGFGRTGTESLKLALEQVGYNPCYHMYEVKKQHIPHWVKAVNSDNTEWDEIYNGYLAAVDWPTSAFLEPLRRKFSHAKVVLTVRPAAEWFESFASTIAPAVQKGVQSHNTDTKLLCSMIDELLKRVFNGDYMNRENAISVFKKHCKYVINNVPEEELLVYELGTGWEPLCNFLSVDVPESQYPNSNTRSEFKKRVGLSRQIKSRNE